MARLSGNERGITYLFLMFVIVLIGIATTTAAKQWKGMIQREEEADLLTKGIEIQNALALYSSTMKAGRVTQGEVYPQSLAELTRLPKPLLRKPYRDPMNHGEWEYLKGPSGGIMGVRSRSVAEPIRKHEFPLPVRHFEGKKSYRDWIFQFPNPSMPSAFLPTAPVNVPPPRGIDQLPTALNQADSQPSESPQPPGDATIPPPAP
ncbi:MAG: type II secretion system protein [Nitrospira sp.]|nr:type II secretion system protein [Nitrospira sp.]